MHPIRGAGVTSCGLLLVVALGMSAAAQDEGARDERFGHGPVAIQAEFNPVGILLDVGMVASAPSYSIGVRIYPADRFGLDVMMGLSLTSEVKRDSANNTYHSEGRKLFEPAIGAVAVPIRGRRASFGAFARFGLSIEERQLSAGVDDHVSYWAAAKRISVGVEPCATSGSGFEFYTGFGLALTFMPNSKYVDTSDPSYDPARGEYPLAERSDARTDFSSSGITIGMRFRF